MLREIQRNPPFFKGKVSIISLQIGKLAICLLLWFHETNDASEKINTDGSVLSVLIFYFILCGSGFICKGLFGPILLVQRTNLLRWF